jgi:flavin-dependent dehydrogenase
VLDRHTFDEWLVQAAAESGVEVWHARARVCRREGTGWRIAGSRGSGDQEVQADFVIDATGSSARSPALDSVRRFYLDSLVSLSFVLPSHPFLHEAAMVEPSEMGWWYAAALGEGRQLVAFFTDADLLARRCRYRLMNEQLAQTTYLQFGASVDAAEKICVSSARTSIRNVLWRRSWLAIGDAAWCLDPLSGTGIERAITDGVSAAAAVSANLKGAGTDPLRTYACARVEAFCEEVARKRRVYGLERRWRSQPFWMRRSSDHFPIRPLISSDELGPNLNQQERLPLSLSGKEGGR